MVTDGIVVNFGGREWVEVEECMGVNNNRKKIK